MTVEFKCSCGRELSVPDDSAGQEAFCPGCRKKVPVPAAGGGKLDADVGQKDGREISEFRPGALANILGEETASPPASPAPVAPAEKDKKVEEPNPAPAAPEKKPAAEVPVKEVKESPAETQDVPPPGVEVFPDKIKWHCECGQKVSAKIPAPRVIGKCPRCGRNLKVPEVPAAPAAPEKKPAPPGESKPPARSLGNCPKCNRRIEAEGAAFCPRCGFPLALEGPQKPEPSSAAESKDETKEDTTAVRSRSARQAAEMVADHLRPISEALPAASPGGIPAGPARRLAALGLDAVAAAGVALAAARIGESVAVGGGTAAGLVGLVGVALLNWVVVASASAGRSLGMVAAGMGVVDSAGRPAGIVRLFARLVVSLPLLPFSFMAFFDAQNRTLHDRICGTTVRRPRPI